ncbi:MAG: SCO family protein [Pirellulales bacterium]|nr:SCO family protein [Pirellulales bacterium]
MKNSTLPYWLSLLVLLTASYGGWKWWQVMQFEQRRAVGGIEGTGPPLQEFQLTERSGKTFHSGDMQGGVWVASFFFSTCPGSCAKLNSNIRSFHQQEELSEVVWVSISVDPDTDTLPVLRDYANRFDADPERWLFCRGDFKYVRRIGQEFFSLPVLWRDHSDYGVVIDRQGQVRGAYNLNKTSEHARLIDLIQECLAEDVSVGEEAGQQEGHEAGQDTRQQAGVAA